MPVYSNLNNYVFPFTIAEESQLVTVGYQEHVGLGGRFGSRVQELLGGASESELRLIASKRDRAMDSAKGFREVMRQYNHKQHQAIRHAKKYFVWENKSNHSQTPTKR